MIKVTFLIINKLGDQIIYSLKIIHFIIGRYTLVKNLYKRLIKTKAKVR
jgi:hypothetical protein